MAKTGEQHYQDYQNYIAEGRVQSAGLSLLTACLCGYCPAQAELGYKYLHGILFPKDYEQAMRWLTAASEQGDAASMTNLATMYMNGRGAQTNGKKAAELLEKAFGLGFAPAARFIGLCCEKGIGYPKSAEEAFSWYQKGADLGDMGSAVLLGDAYEHGKGTAKDLEKARHWYELAAAGEGEEAETAREALESMKKV